MTEGFNSNRTTSQSNEHLKQDRRRFPRLQCRLPLQYRNLNKNHCSMTGALTRDLSAGGMRFISNDFLPVSARLNLELSLDSHTHTISAAARVVWVQKLPYNENFMIGLEFMTIENEDRIKIIRYVNEYSQGESSGSTLR